MKLSPPVRMKFSCTSARTVFAPCASRLREPHARAEAAIAVPVGRRHRHHEDVEGLVEAGRDLVGAPAADREVVDLAGVHHVAVEGRGVVVADREAVLLAFAKPREEPRSVVDADVLKLSAAGVEGVAEGEGSAGEWGDTYAVAGLDRRDGLFRSR